MAQKKSVDGQQEKKRSIIESVVRLCSTCSDILVVDIQYVGSSLIQRVRHSLRGKAEIIIGKNANLRQGLEEAEHLGQNSNLSTLRGAIIGKVAIVFVLEPFATMDVASLIGRETRPGRAVANKIASESIWIRKGHRLWEPGGGSGYYLSALNIYSEVKNGLVEVSADKELVAAGEKVNATVEAFFSHLNFAPFTREMKVTYLFQGGRLIPFSSLPTEEALSKRFQIGLQNVRALQLATT